MNVNKEVFASDFLSDFNEVIFVRDWTTFPEDAGINKDVQLRTLNLCKPGNPALVDNFIAESYEIDLGGIVGGKNLISSFDTSKDGKLYIGLGPEGESYLKNVVFPNVNYKNGGTGTGR